MNKSVLLWFKQAIAVKQELEF